ncbi:unnamed protein product [Polarella glacialis]|uniref:Uncharacterized protein n=1 Tax=Polarella glacialis TaxID=89957 RepID=A0A813EHR7_POLGL|nr:unnamed protein product [Polarella glacialis]
MLAITRDSLQAVEAARVRPHKVDAKEMLAIARDSLRRAVETARVRPFRAVAREMLATTRDSLQAVEAARVRQLRQLMPVVMVTCSRKTALERLLLVAARASLSHKEI